MNIHLIRAPEALRCRSQASISDTSCSWVAIVRRRIAGVFDALHFSTGVYIVTDTNFADPLTEVLRNHGRALLAQAVEAEVAALLSMHADKLTDGRARLVRHGHLPEREIMTGIGPVAVRCPRVRDRAGEGSDRIRFSSAILPPYARRSKSLEALIPILYLKGISVNRRPTWTPGEPDITHFT